MINRVRLALKAFVCVLRGQMVVYRAYIDFSEPRLREIEGVEGGMCVENYFEFAGEDLPIISVVPAEKEGEDG